MNDSTASQPFDYESALAACARGDAAALRAIYEREAPRLIGVALRVLHRRELASEVVHDAFVQIWRKAGTFNPAFGSGRGWIYCVVRHRALTVLRDHSRDVELDEEAAAEVPADESADPMRQAARLSDASALQRCLDRLDEQKRSCIVLAYVDGLTARDIAAHLKAPLGTVKSWIRRGLQSLRECMR